jgi:YHS domain-containing protein
MPAAAAVAVEPQVQAGAGHDDSTAAHDGAAASDAAAGEMTAADPVRGMHLDPATASEHRGHGTHDIYFCSARCTATFDTGPHRYAAAAARSAPGEGVPLVNRIRLVTCGSSVRQAARVRSLIRPLRTGFRWIRFAVGGTRVNPAAPPAGAPATLSRLGGGEGRCARLLEGDQAAGES